jgi:hypothetical protein
MIIFRARFVAPILDGRKTQTRRLWSKARVRAGGIYEGRTYRAGKPFARLHMLEIWKERLGDIREEDSVKEGYPTSAEFLKDFFAIHNGKFSPRVDWLDHQVWALSFEVTS